MFNVYWVYFCQLLSVMRIASNGTNKWDKAHYICVCVPRVVHYGALLMFCWKKTRFTAFQNTLLWHKRKFPFRTESASYFVGSVWNFLEIWIPRQETTKKSWLIICDIDNVKQFRVSYRCFRYFVCIQWVNFWRLSTHSSNEIQPKSNKQNHFSF